MKKSRSYPERLKEAHERQTAKERTTLQNQLKYHVETINTYREKDHDRAQQLADLGSPSSRDVVVRMDWRARCCNTASDIVKYFLEREEKSKAQDETIQRKSYAGFYYFIKWFTRALFFLVFTTLGTIAGKEIGCEIKDHHVCDSGVVELANSSPHIVSSVIGSICGLIIGQWIGRFVWDKGTLSVRKCLRYVEKRADKTKCWLIVTAVMVYISVTTAFATVFFFFVNLNQDDENIIGGIVGGCTGLVLAVLAYRKSSSCRSGQVSETPMTLPSNSTVEPPIIIV